MTSYKFSPADLSGVVHTVQRLSDMAFVPFSEGNEDCVQFLIDWKNGASVTNADGSAAPYSTAAVTALGLVPAP